MAPVKILRPINKYSLWLLEKRWFIVCVILIFLVTFLAFEQTLKMYLWTDIYSLIYKVNHPHEQAGVYGTGILGRDGPYRWTAVFFLPFYLLFGLEPKGYYLVGIIFYFLASMTVYFFAKILTENKKIALGASLIFASGYVGSSSLYEIDDSYHNLISAILLTLTAAFYYKFIKSKRWLFYIITLLLYFTTMEVAYIRAHGIFLFILCMEALFNLNITKSSLRMAPFLIGYLFNYVFSTGNYLSLTGNTGNTSLIQSFIRVVFIDRNFTYLLTPFQTLENIFIPDKFNLPLWIFIVILSGVLIWKKNKILLYSLIFTVSNFLVYFLYYPQGVQQTAHRYLNPSFVGSSIFLSSLMYFLFQRKYKYLYFLLVGFVVVFNLTQVRGYQESLVLGISQPSRKFWESLKSQIPSLPKGSALYFDIKNEGSSKPAYVNAITVGAMPGLVSFATHYDLNQKELFLPETFDELLELLHKNKVSTNNFYTFFYSLDTGIVNTTETTRNALFSNPSKFLIKDLSNVNIKHTSPAILDFTLSVKLDFQEPELREASSGILMQYLPYLSSKQNFYKTATFTASSQAKYTEISNIHDQNPSTSWRAFNDFIHNSEPIEVTVDLGVIKRIGGVKIVPAAFGRIPTKYTYECSQDGEKWGNPVNFEKKVDKVTTYVDKFSETLCQFIKLRIYDTVLHDSPQISEMEVLENNFEDLNFELADKVNKNPFLYAASPDQRELLIKYIIKNGYEGDICVLTDKFKPTEPQCQKYKFQLGTLNGSLQVRQGGTVIQKIKFVTPPEIRVNVMKLTLEHLTYKQLEKVENQ